MKPKQFKTDWAGRELKVEIGQLAGQANGSVLLTYGQTTVLATAVVDKDPSDVDYMPLSVNYEEKLYAAGKIKSGRFIKREGRPSDESVLTGRMIDRVIRPCFNSKIRNSIQIALTVLSFDKENDPDIPSLVAASLALGISDIPWDGLVGGIRIGRSSIGQAGSDQEWVLNPTYQAREQSDFDLVVAGKADKISMLEGSASQVPEEILLAAMEFVQPHLKKIIDFQDEIVKEAGKEKKDLEIKETDSKLANEIEKWLDNKLEKAVYQEDKVERAKDIVLLETELVKALDDENGSRQGEIREIFNDQVDELVHQNILKNDKRPDFRKLDEVRPIAGKVGLLERTHGSALFNRGTTQALSVVTLGGPSEGQTIDGMEFDMEKTFMHHYNFPPYSVGETGRIGGPGRREIGHGALAEKSLLPLIPKKEDFPYTIRLVSEILSSNGSSSMASVSGSSLALMDAGVPIKNHVTGVAMGLIMGPDTYKILTDIQGPEDHHGDMDCKVAGTKNGVTGCQMDVKIEGVSLEILKKAFVQAKKARLGIIKDMEKAIKEPRPELSPLAPRIITIQIDKDQIRTVIGPGGKMINEIVDQTGAKIDIEDDGLVSITSLDEEGGKKAFEWIKNLTREVKPGEVFQGRVTKITDFGAFVEILPGQEGLVHISELADYRVEKVEDVVKTGQTIPVKVKKVDELGRINLTVKGVDNNSK